MASVLDRSNVEVVLVQSQTTEILEVAMGPAGLPGAKGERGEQGLVGLRGPKGDPGVDSDKYYAHDQAQAEAQWAIEHNLNKYPSVTITDSAGDQVEGEVRYNGLNSLTVRFSAPFAGKAYLN